MATHRNVDLTHSVFLKYFLHSWYAYDMTYNMIIIHTRDENYDHGENIVFVVIIYSFFFQKNCIASTCSFLLYGHRGRTYTQKRTLSIGGVHKTKFQTTEKGAKKKKEKEKGTT